MRRILIATVALAACEPLPMSNLEVREALDEAVAATKAEEFSGDVVEITTDFTIGEGVEAAAAELRAWLESQMDCATVTLEGHTLTIDFGELGDACTYQGKTYAGIASVTVNANDGGGVALHHEWIGLTNGEITLDGTADVTWSGSGERHIVHDVMWTDGDHHGLHATGDRTQTWLDGDWSQGLVIDGWREWESERGTWSLDIDAVQLRWWDPVPEAGQYVLTNPAGKQATLVFTRIDEDTIEVRLEGARQPHVWHVTRAGVTEVAA